MRDELDLRTAILRRLNILTGIIVVFAVILGSVIAYGYSKAHQNTLALCALRADLDQRIVSSQGVLIAHPDGLAGISAAVIKQQISNSQRTRHTLRNLSC